MRTNWAGSHVYEASDLVTPTSVAEVQELVAVSPRIRALGSRHSFTDLADTPGLQVSLAGLPSTVEVVGDAVRVPAGLRYGDLATELAPRGLALANLASLPHISVAGAVATGTHGSGRRNPSLAAAVRGLEMVSGTGELLRLSGADLAGAVVGLGALGIVTSLDLAVEPAYDLTQVVYEGLAWPALLERLEDVLGCAYSVSVFTTWVGEEVGQVWVKERTAPDSGTGAPAEPVETLLAAGARPATEQRHMIAGMSVENTTAQLGVAGPWHERLPHFRMGFQPSAGEELQTEYLVPLSRAAEAVAAVRGLGEALREVLFVTELRTIAADDLWLSGAYGEDALALHFTWHREASRVHALVERLEEVLLPLGARPHWGKVFAARAEALAPLYPRWDDFLDLVTSCDPQGRFRNAWTERHLGI
ncbi:D-arabinono-1,4-lactone oxidase [Nocardioides sp. BP30]|uniref:D-arabinono-1,4-lactone oxidase n=1 Tax=Nocardioides sp. BP30 TaxID=3036374 RepID=UPI0024686500|nr:D-arabinono-1,4-lactone oxidase [Nocardioides sp. BP30]WGL52526.1 D-arabinono-1,4-lactone oxidase [Nocardioides sp. BP30]